MRIHRRIWWHAKYKKLLRVVWYFQQLFFLVRWVLFTGWVDTFSVVKLTHEEITKHYGISYCEQLCRCLGGAIGWLIPADDLYSYQVIQMRALRNSCWVITPNGPMLMEGNSGWGLQD